MNKIVLSLLSLCLLIPQLHSQNRTKKITVSGTVLDKSTEQPVEQATVRLLTLPDSAFVSGKATDAKGKFILPKVTAGRYLLKISYIGYKNYYQKVQLTSSKPSVKLAPISLLSDAIVLSEAVITAEAPPVTVKADTTEYSAAAYPVPEGSMLEDLIKKIPGAEVDDNGKITLNGKEIKKIMVDGKEFFTDDPKISMKNLPVSIIEKVKAYDKKSDMARITGVDDGEEEPVLDLKIKKGMKKGWIGNLIAGYGSDQRYEAGAMVSRFKGDSNISIIGSSNNTNNAGFSEFGDAGQGLGGNVGSGITASNSLGVNFSKETKKFQANGYVQYGHTNRDVYTHSKSETFLIDESVFDEDTRFNNRSRDDFRANLRFEWRPDTLTTILFRPDANYSKTKYMRNDTAKSEDNNHELINTKRSLYNSKSEDYSINGSLMFFRRLNSNGRHIFASFRMGYSDTESDDYSYSLSEFQKLDSISNINRYTDANRDSRNWSVSASYTEPIFKNHFLQLRYQFAHRKQLSQSLVYDSIVHYPYPEYIERGYDDELSTRVENFYDTHTATVSLRGVYPKLMYNVGVSATPQSSLSKTTIGPNYKKNLPKQNVLNWAPSIGLRYKFSDQHMLMFRYRGRSSSPNIRDLQEVIDITDPMSMHYGNPNLKPSFNNYLMFYYNRFIPKSMISYTANVFYNSTINSVANKMTYDPETGARIYRKENVNGNWRLRSYFSLSTPLKNKKYTINSSAVFSYSDAVSFTNLSKSKSKEQVLSTTHNFFTREMVRAAYRSDEFDISLFGQFNYNAIRNSVQENSNRETFDYYVGGNTNINLPWEVSVSTDLNCRFKDGYLGDSNDRELLWNAQISKNFLANNAATIRFKIYDILKEQSNLSRNITETMMKDTEYNTLGSYFMFHFVYRFNTFGGKRPQSNYRGRSHYRRMHRH